MRLIISILLLSVCYPLECGTQEMNEIENERYTSIINNISEYSALYRNQSTSIDMIPITFHIIQDGFGNSPIGSEDLDQIIIDANDEFGDLLHIRFYEFDTIFINDSTYFDIDYDESEYTELTQNPSTNIDGTLNIYFVDTIYHSVDDRYIAGFAWPAGTQHSIFLNNNTTNSIPNSTFIHEMGHYFYLKHTHAGSDDPNGDYIIDGENAEFVDGTDCDARGDELCDTPADPKLSSLFVDLNCNYIGEYTDGHGDTYSPETKNHMSYSRKSCRSEFSYQQEAIMLIHYFTSIRGTYLDCNDELGGTEYPDCSGECGGNAYVDECGICDNDPINDCIQDECDVWGGDGDCVQDECGIWGGDGVLLWDACYSIENTEYIYLSNSNLTGQIPESIGYLTNLKGLSLSGNQLSGEIPSTIGNLINLTYLWMSSNELSGLIPESICNLPIDWDGTNIDSGAPYFSIFNNNLCLPYPECIENDVGSQSCSGCTSFSACNYNPHATNDDGCIYAEDGYDCDGNEIEGCLYEIACNYNEIAIVDDGSCVFAEEDHDCDGNCTAGLDCNDVCGGSAVEDGCGICGGDGSDDVGCGCFEDGPSGCDNACGSTLENDACGVCGGDGSDDLGCGCFEPGPSGCDNECGSTATEDCAGECGGNSVVDNCDVCDDDPSNDNIPLTGTCGMYSMPITPVLQAIVDSNTVILTWDNLAVQSIDSLTGYSDFEGYRIYKSIDGGATWGYDNDKIYYNGDFKGWKPFSQFDLTAEEDSIHCLKGFTNDGCVDNLFRGKSIHGPDPYAPWINLGDNSGLPNINEFNQFIFIDSNVMGGVEYTYSVTAYDIGVEEPYAITYGDIDGDGIYSSDTLYSIINPDGWSAYKSLESPIGITNFVTNIYTDIYGCTNESACNYNPDATEDDGSCKELDCTGECGGDDISCLAIEKIIIPDNYSIHSIYPNPFNPVTSIIYGLPEYVNVQIIVYNISGKQIETLINQFQSPGYYSINWNADTHSSGVYFVKMVAGSYVNTQKLMLVK